MQRDEPEERDEAQSNGGASLVTRIGTAVGGGVLAAAMAALPPMMRMGGTGWLALAAIAIPFTIVAIGVLRGARMGAKIAFGARPGAFATGLLAWATFELLALAAFASLLRKHTHHHGLAAVTFAIFAATSGIVLALAIARAVRIVVRRSATVQRGALVVATLSAFVVLIASGLRTADADGLRVSTGLVDALALAIGCGIASSRFAARQRALAIVGVPLAAIVLALGLSTLKADPTIRSAFAGAAPVHALFLSTLSR